MRGENTKTAVNSLHITECYLDQSGCGAHMGHPSSGLGGGTCGHLVPPATPDLFREANLYSRSLVDTWGGAEVDARSTGVPKLC